MVYNKISKKTSMVQNQENQSQNPIYTQANQYLIFGQEFPHSALYEFTQSQGLLHGIPSINSTTQNSIINISINSIESSSKKITRNHQLPSSSPKSRKFQNTMSSNYCLKETLGFNNLVYSKFLQFKTKFSIKSQVWAFEAILTFLLFLRDQTSFFTTQTMTLTKKFILERISNQTTKVLDKDIRQKRQAYAKLTGEFLAEETGFESLRNLKQTRQYFYDTIVIKKRTINAKCLFMMEHVRESLVKQKQFWCEAPKIQGNDFQVQMNGKIGVSDKEGVDRVSKDGAN